MDHPREFPADLGLLGIVLIWGVNFSVVKAVLDSLSPPALNALRFPLAAGVLYLLMRRLPGPALRPGDRRGIIALGLLGNVVYQFFFIYGIDRTLAGNASLFLATPPVWTILLSAALGHERPTWQVTLGAGCTLAGIGLVVAGGEASLTVGGRTLLGDGLMLGAAMLWAAYTVLSQPYVMRYGPLRVAAWTLWAGTPFLVLAGLPSLLHADWAAVDLWVWSGVAYAGVFALAVAYLLWYRGVQRLGNSRTAIYSNLVPIVALLTAWLWLGEVPAPLQLGGAAVIIGGVFLARLGGRRTSAGPR